MSNNNNNQQQLQQQWSLQELNEWLKDKEEPAFCFDVPIIDPHFHVFPSKKPSTVSVNFIGNVSDARTLSFGIRRPTQYEFNDFKNEWINNKVNIIKVIHMEAGSKYDSNPNELKKHLDPVGESKWLSKECDPTYLLGCVVKVDLKLTNELIEECIREHEKYVNVVGVRYGLANHTQLVSAAGKDSYLDIARGVNYLGTLGFCFDVWFYYHQFHEIAYLAKSCPSTTICCNHVGCPIDAKKESVFQEWMREVEKISKFPNVVIKFGGMLMHFVGFAKESWEGAYSSNELVRIFSPWFQVLLKCFGPERIICESNFPMDKANVSYVTYWNAVKKLMKQFVKEPSQRRMMLFVKMSI